MRCSASSAVARSIRPPGRPSPPPARARRALARVAAGPPGQHRERVVVDGGGRRGRARGRRAPAAAARHLVLAERPQLVDLRPGEQRRVDLEERVLGRRADQRHQALLDGGQQRVLLGLVEAVDLVEEEDGPAPVAAPLLGALEHRPDLGAAGVDRRLLLEGAVGGGRDDPGDRRLAGARRSVEDHRVRLAGLDRGAQRRALGEQVLLADEVVERARAHPDGERRPLAGAARRRLVALEQLIAHRASIHCPARSGSGRRDRRGAPLT